MKIIPINNQNQISHKAVNQKFFNQAKNEFIKYSPHHNLLPIIGNITNKALYKLISTQDAIDTFEAIKPFAQNQSIIEAINDKIDVVKGLLPNQ